MYVYLCLPNNKNYYVRKHVVYGVFVRLLPSIFLFCFYDVRNTQYTVTHVRMIFHTRVFLFEKSLFFLRGFAYNPEIEIIQ